ncbi:MAG: hypothetical protein ACQR33_01785 [Candidatus Saccharibacteria bacterium]
MSTANPELPGEALDNYPAIEIPDFFLNGPDDARFIRGFRARQYGRTFNGLNPENRNWDQDFTNYLGALAVQRAETPPEVVDTMASAIHGLLSQDKHLTITDYVGAKSAGTTKDFVAVRPDTSGGTFLVRLHAKADKYGTMPHISRWRDIQSPSGAQASSYFAHYSVFHSSQYRDFPHPDEFKGLSIADGQLLMNRHIPGPKTYENSPMATIDGSMNSCSYTRLGLFDPFGVSMWATYDIPDHVPLIATTERLQALGRFFDQLLESL